MASEALQAVLDLLLLDLDFEVVKAGHVQENQASKRLLAKMGFQLVAQKKPTKRLLVSRLSLITMNCIGRSGRTAMVIELHNLSSRFKVRKLTDADLEQVLALYQTNPLYFEHFPPLPSLASLANDLVDCPPGKELSDKYFLGFWDQDSLVAVLDLIDGYPAADTAYIGLFMVEQAYQGRGLGSTLVEEIIAGLPGRLKKVRLGYVSSNPQAKAFWIKCGFSYLAEKELACIPVTLAERWIEQ
ncbi:GNAT family N-acetyltransferase [Streptococcus suis]|uniref:GNAT family N-acetyltransferase n=2 Tax=Streptococcus suivaginalis TaxID=3028082 RepID=A0AA97A9G1_9STRE|nr:GNAT family N-acetyltransferase [Streptococcus sp. 29896]MCK4027236.1 GNAT family N-acetyltransferase [Streptococcus suis]WNY46581.1 GNAT family N-acetyltransferase [Streptococcus sp. 29896]